MKCVQYTRALFICAALLAGGAQGRTTAYVLIVGNNAPPPSDGESLPTLRYADDDAARYFHFFRRFADGVRVLSVLDPESQRRYPEVAAQARPPSLAELKGAIEEFRVRLRADVERGDEPIVYFAFSGHGAQGADGSYFLALQEGKLTQQQLYDEVLSKLEPAFVHLFIDACHSESVVGGRGRFAHQVDVPLAAVDSGEAQRAFETRLPARFPRVGAIMATTADQQAHEWSRLESGVFTHELLSALSGAADVNADQILEYSELAAFIASANRTVADPRAIPKVVALAPRVNVHAPVLALASLKDSGFLKGQFAVGHFHVELENGQRLLDANFALDQSAAVALPAGRAFLVAGDREVELLIRVGETTRAETLKLAPRADTPRGAVGAALAKALFETPFGAAYYRGYVDSRGETSVSFALRNELKGEGSAALQQRKVVAGTTLGAGGVLLVGAVVSSVLAVNAHTEYANTDLQRPAFEAKQRSNGFAVAAAISGGAGVALGAIGWWLWPAAESGSKVTASAYFEPQGAGLIVGGSLRD